MNNTFAIESFIDYCDDMIIGNESVDSKIVAVGMTAAIVAGVYYGGKVVKRMIKSNKEKPKKNTLTKLPNIVYLVSDKKMEDVFKVQGTVYPHIDKLSAIRSFVYTIPGGDTGTGYIKINKSNKKYLNTKLCVYTLDGNGVSRTSVSGLIEASKDLPIKKVEEGSYEELLRSNNIEIRMSDVDINARKKMLKKYEKEYLALVKEAGIAKGVYPMADDIDNENFVYGSSDRAYIASWDLWDYNPTARTDAHDNEDKNIMFYDAIDGAVKEMNKRYPVLEFEDDCDWDGGYIHMRIKKK